MPVTPKFRFVGIPLVALPEAERTIGPFVGSFFAEEAATGAHPPANFGLYRAGGRAVLRHLASSIGLAPGDSPFFVDGAPIAVPYVLTDEERAIAYRA